MHAERIEAEGRKKPTWQRVKESVWNKRFWLGVLGLHVLVFVFYSVTFLIGHVLVPLFTALLVPGSSFVLPSYGQATALDALVFGGLLALFTVLLMPKAKKKV